MLVLHAVGCVRSTALWSISGDSCFGKYSCLQERFQSFFVRSSAPLQYHSCSRFGSAGKAELSILTMGYPAGDEPGWPPWLIRNKLKRDDLPAKMIDHPKNSIVLEITCQSINPSDSYCQCWTLGKVNCVNCLGFGRIRCPNCSGMKEVRCHNCHGFAVGWNKGQFEALHGTV